MSWYSFIQKYFGLIFAASMAAGLFVPGPFLFIADYALPILGAVMGLTFLSIDFEAVLANLKKWKPLAVVFLVTKAALPLILYHAAAPLGETAAAASLLLSLTPFAAISPTLTRVVGGDAEFVLVEQVTQTLAAPLYMPVFFKLIAGQAIEIDALAMVRVLVCLIIVPFVIAAVVRRFLMPGVLATRRYYGAVSIILISVLLLGLLASASAPIMADPIRSLPLGLMAMALAFVLLGSAWFIFFFLERGKRLGASLGNVYMNVGLTAVLAAGFFSADVLLFVLLYEIPANLLPPLLRRLGPKETG